MLRKVFLSCLILLILSHLESIRVFAQNEELTLKEMCNQSTDIVIAKIVAKNSYYSFDKKDVFTDVTLKVTKKIKGKFKTNEEIKIKTYGGTIDGITTLIVGGPSFQENTSSVYFFEEKKSTKTGKIENHRIVGFSQGKFDIIEEKNEKKVKRDSGFTRFVLDDSGESLDFSHGKSFSLDNFIQQITKHL